MIVKRFCVTNTKCTTCHHPLPPQQPNMHTQRLTRANRGLLVKHGIIDITDSCQGSSSELVAINTRVHHGRPVGCLGQSPEGVGHGRGFRAATRTSGSAPGTDVLDPDWEGTKTSFPRPSLPRYDPTQCCQS